jgi:hypothetical protein
MTSLLFDRKHDELAVPENMTSLLFDSTSRAALQYTRGFIAIARISSPISPSFFKAIQCQDIKV